ncbi:MAG: class I SAM-dependent methyltransferase [Oscillospiraceae bacterium]|nr:class I SAM-dependent methyltransferase [Oscillospiraceae bacterium]
MPHDSHILDMGCGAGYIGAEIAEHYNARLTAVDFDEGSIAHAKKTFSSNSVFNFICGDGCAVSFETAAFDLICFCDSLHFTRTDDKLYALLDKCWTVLKPGGKLAIFRGKDSNQVIIWGQNNNISLKTVDLTETNKNLFRGVFVELITMAPELQKEVPETYERIKNECIEYHLQHIGWDSRQLYIFNK